MDGHETVYFELGGVMFEYDEEKNRINKEKHGVTLLTAARIFFDEDRVEFYDDIHSVYEDRYVTIGDTAPGLLQFGSKIMIGNVIYSLSTT